MIPLAVTAHNEEQAIGSCLQSLLAAVAHAEARLPLRFDVLVVLDDCTDRTAEIAAAFQRIRTIVSSGGLVEAQRAAVRPAPFIVFSDADIFIEPVTLFEVCRVMLECPQVQVAYPSKAPLRPLRRSLLAGALYVFNRDNGYQTPRRYFNGKFFAIRHWHIPTVEELRPRLQALPADRFYAYERGVVADDIYLSRWLLHEYGRESIREVPEGRIWFRPPETFEGMYRTYRRMRREIERINAIFPETCATHRRDGVRRCDRRALRQAAWQDRWSWRLFQAALVVCQVRYLLDRFYHQHLSRRKGLEWGTVTESKHPIRAGSA
jgi:glycosyltransferase involved in cell wall biosynthesis